ncbi:HK97-gp10 family putative phage morphogenesis protein [Streptomyces sp. CA-250714]|uniref:HK97-gp10 family putative phage morphogenesis protein n=1 Tax=Streptomyces sp. CA-250714 TaxID=3240060 RepID=UPI003D8B88A0
MGTLLRRLRLLPSRANSARDDALREWAEALEKTARDLAPVRTGRLRESIHAHINTTSGKAWVQVDGAAREYAYYVEKGTSKMSDQPFMGPASHIHRRTGERLMRRSVARRLFGRW